MPDDFYSDFFYSRNINNSGFSRYKVEIDNVAFVLRQFSRSRSLICERTQFRKNFLSFP